ncbi:hypothetical protein P175DRAFT_0506336 [Aspergillus ochraceoroseus IBT 24754]|uniref:Ribonucleases P/MRP subunit Pop8-like domain-containing protein n=2 Tax=Aspergillus ochraceoroseus TaxID=138278 RepID=A0A2T5M885_9EURO|nr:uncharacterized protein P175DRAFT_0506336 [Aspergillus ochraceoroseus IBT 24754]KKK14803.1 hypothetical protein AOCH_005576 [Aspergillus ochraceoroseus]PTU24750.1 hypothetical protein P175DRAFT_0506336 [Aspergillus ochraceoroseus IBT 24754]
MASTKRKATEDSFNTINFTARNPPWTYLKLQLIHQPGTSTAVQCQPIDPLTARTYLTAALHQFLGLSGTSIAIDILKVSPETSHSEPTDKFIWIRIPRQDAPAVVAAVSSWIGGNTGSDTVGSVAWRVCAKGNFLGALVHGSGIGLFAP